ncbi:MAG: glycosyltransferase family 4 protein [Alphaproteobacteria bacterium]|nr:glycosyltransferase family 4 protein [Alphaproteobacteria bacterium]
MKILFFIGQLYGGGAERVATTLLNHLSERNEVIAVISHDTRKSYPLNQNVKIRKTTYSGRFKATKLFDRTKKIRNIINDTKPDLIISFLAELNGCTLLANTFCRRTIIVSERTALERKQSLWHSFSRRILYMFADNVVFVSKTDYCSSHWLKRKTIIYNPLTFSTTNTYEKRQKSIVAIGWQSRWHIKGFDLLIQAWSKIAKSHPEWKMQFIGLNNDNYINDLAKSYGIENQVDFLGWTDEIDKVLQTKSIYVLSSRNEGFPNSLIEAMSQGCACVAFDCKTGPNEILTEGKSGVLARNGDVDDLAAKLQLLIENDNLRQRLSASAAEDVKRFDKDLIMKQWDELIQLTVES